MCRGKGVQLGLDELVSWSGWSEGGGEVEESRLEEESGGRVGDCPELRLPVAAARGWPGSGAAADDWVKSSTGAKRSSDGWWGFRCVCARWWSSGSDIA